MNEGGNALIGFFLLVGFVLAFGWPAAAIIGVPLFIDFLIGHTVKSQRNFRYLEPIEQALRRASQGFALMAFALLGAVVPYVWLYGWRNFQALGPWFIAHPADAWPLGLLAAAFLVGFVRFRAGMQALAGARDPMRAAKGLLKFFIGLGCVGYLTVNYSSWNALAYDAERWPFILGVALIYAAGFWWVLVGGMRFMLLSMPVRQPKMPRAFPGPYGAAGDATPHEASAAMRGYGGRRTRLDDERF